MENNTNQSAVVGIEVANGGEVFNDYENNTASGRNSHSEGEATEASAIATHSEGSESKAMQIAAHAEGYSFAAGHGSHAENGSIAEGDYSHSEGYLTKTMSANSHSENAYTIAAAQSSHAEGDLTLTEGIASHSEGESTETTGNKSHAEGKQTKAGGDGSHAEGEATEAIGADSHAEGKNTKAVGARSFAGGNSTVATADNQTVIGAFNLNRSDTLFEIGNGASDTERSNAFEVYSDGSVALGGEKISPSQLQSLIDMLPTLGTDSATAMWLQAGKPILDTVESGSDERWFEFVPSETGRHVVYSEGNINIKATLYDSALTPLASDNSGGWGYNFRIYENLTCGEKYYICVQSETGSTGSYYMNANALSAMQEAATSEAAATITEFNKGIEKEYCNANGQIWHRFTANAAEAHVDGKTGEYIISIACDGILSGNLYNSKMEVVWGHDIFQYSNSFFAGYELAYGEEYYFCSKVSAMPIEHNIAINYTRDSSYCAGTEDDPFIIKNIYEPVTATISTPGEEKWFKLTVNSSYDKIIIHSEGQDVRLVGELYNVDKSLLISTEDFVPSEQLREPPYNFYMSRNCLGGETYYIRITARNNETGSFEVRWTDEVFVENISFEKAYFELPVGEYATVEPTLEPENTTDTRIDWKSDDESVATVSQNGEIRAISAGMATITATAGSYPPVSKSVFVRVFVPTERVLMPEEVALDIGQTYTFATVPEDATSQNVEWEVDDSDNVIRFNPITCTITALKAGIATITAKPEQGIESSCTIWVRGKTPVFLIHGRTDHSCSVWGIENGIGNWQNTHYEQNIAALSEDNKRYIDPEDQAITKIYESSHDIEKPCNFGFELEKSGYTKNINFFVFNYPNQDAVVHSAMKLELYINTLVNEIRFSGSNEMKTCFYSSKSAFEENNFKINIVGHSMGGLVARYYIENLGQDSSVDKLITICTPHWGSGYANLACFSSIEHVIADHDLMINSEMFGGSNEEYWKDGCKIIVNNWKCTSSNYQLSDELLYSKSRTTKYYAIAGIDYPKICENQQNDYCFEITNNLITYQDLVDFMGEKNVYKNKLGDFTPKTVGDNMVGFLSQIGWTEQGSNSPNKRVPMEKIFVDVDCDGGNTGGVFLWEMLNANKDPNLVLHGKIPHRRPVCDKIIEYLEA